MQRLIIAYGLAIGLFLSACQSAAPTEPPTNTAAPTVFASATAIPSATAEPPTATVVLAVPTAVPTAAPTDTVESQPTATASSAAGLVSSVQLEPVVGGFVKPLGLTHAGDGRLFVVEQAGVIRIVADGEVLLQPFLDIVEGVNSNANEQGLLGLAFHPRYAENGYFYVNYTRADNATVIARYRVSPDDPNTADPTSEAVLLVIPQPFRNHNGGQIQFGPDGYLYVGMGDGGSRDDPQNQSQNNQTLLGAMLRLDVDGAEPYAIPADNPFGNEVWAIGLRNPWRFSFDRLTGDLFIGDVGQDVWEEISFQPAASPGGENYGWKIFEGNNCYLGACDTPGLTPPIATYSHDGRHCAVTGGYVYRGRQYPALNGSYFFADYCSGVIWRLLPNGNGTWDMAQVGQADFLVSSFGEDADGEVYVLGQSDGMIYRLTP